VTKTAKENLITVIKSVYVETGFAPSMAEAAEKMSMTKGGALSAMFKELEADGVIIYSENRKSYIPSDWRELIAGGAKNAALEAIREQTRKRTQEWRERKRNQSAKK